MYIKRTESHEIQDDVQRLHNVKLRAVDVKVFYSLLPDSGVFYFLLFFSVLVTRFCTLPHDKCYSQAN
ncbi:unnamed protein product [Tenebrio molitor]|nr:unnamed protein product [Tenebrio molitor]